MSSVDWGALLAMGMYLCTPLYIILQIWFGCAWTGRWRLAALSPLVVLVVFLITYFVRIFSHPELGRPEFGQFDMIFSFLVVFSVPGSIYLLLIAIARMMFRRRRSNLISPNS